MSKNSDVTSFTSPSTGSVTCEDRRLQHLGRPAAGRRRRCRRRTAARRRAAGPVDRRGLTQLVPAAGQVAEHQRQPGHQPAGEPAAGLVVAAEQQVHREDDDGVEQDPGDHLEHHRSALGGQRRGRSQPRPARRAARAVARGARWSGSSRSSAAGAGGAGTPGWPRRWRRRPAPRSRPGCPRRGCRPGSR